MPRVYIAEHPKNVHALQYCTCITSAILTRHTQLDPSVSHRRHTLL